MPGIAGYALDPHATPPAKDERARMRRVLAGARNADDGPAAAWGTDSAGAALAVATRDGVPSDRGPVTIGSETLVFEGELFGDATGEADPARRLLSRYQAGGDAALAEVEGRFAAAIWSDATGELTLVSDKLGSKPLYWNAAGGAVRFASRLRAITESLPAAPPLDRTGLAQFFTFGHLWNGDTFYESIRCLGPAQRVTLNPRTGEARTATYWRPGRGGPSDDPAASLDRLSSTLRQAIDEQTADADGLGVALSGGLDARTLLALVDPDRVRPPCVSLGMRGSLDQRSARRLAELAGCAYHQLVLGEGFLGAFPEHLERMVGLTDGHYLSQCIVMPTMPLYGRLGVRKLLRGHAGELLHLHKAYNFSVDGAFASVRTRDDLRSWLTPRLQSHLTDGLAEPLLAGVSQAELAERADASLREALGATDHHERPIDRLSQLFLDQRTRRETAMSLSKFNAVVDVRVPYFDGRFLDAVFAAPASLRIGETTQAELLRRHRPEFLRPANSNTGAPVGVGEAHKRFCYYRMRLLAKLGVPGYQPYERLGLWLRRELAGTVRRVLLDDRCLGRGVLNPDGVRNSVDRHTRGAANHTYLLMAMMILELGLRSVGDAEEATPERSTADPLMSEPPTPSDDRRPLAV